MRMGFKLWWGGHSALCGVIYYYDDLMITMITIVMMCVFLFFFANFIMSCIFGWLLCTRGKGREGKGACCNLVYLPFIYPACMMRIFILSGARPVRRV